MAEAGKNLSPLFADVAEELRRYKIISRLGKGGMGSVYLAEDTELGRRVAIKVPEFGSDDGAETRLRFREEARTAATLDHPYLCPVYDVGESNGRLYLVMAYIEGKSLAESLNDQGIPPVQVAALVGKLALALKEAHEKGVVHRDLKPANVMIKTSGSRREPVIVDFGLARRHNSDDVRLTKTGQVMGTLGYMAPEQIRGDLKEIGPASDIYALGVILYELLTGRLPFSGSGLAIAGQILTQNPLPLVSIRPNLDLRLQAICLKAMARNPRDRYATMGELAGALTEFIQAARRNSSTSPDRGAAHIKKRLAGDDSLVNQLLAGHSTVQRPIGPPPAVEIPTPTTPRPRHLTGKRMAIATAALVVGLVSIVVTDFLNRKPKENGTSAKSDSPLGEQVSIPLFNGKDLSGWRGYSQGLWSEPEGVVYVDHGEMVADGTKPPGGITTHIGYYRYRLRFEYLIPESAAPVASGVQMTLLPTELRPGKVQAIGCQLGPGRAGELWACDGPGMIWPPRGDDVEKIARLVERKADAERPRGEWNSVELRADGKKIRFTLNGRVVNETETDDPIAGPIAFRNHLPGLRIRNLRIVPIDPNDLHGSTVHDGRSVVGTWILSHDGQQDGSMELAGDGAIMQGGRKNGDWLHSESHLFLRWPNFAAPGGYWLDTVTLSDDGTQFEGANQQGSRVSGVLSK